MCLRHVGHRDDLHVVMYCAVHIRSLPLPVIFTVKIIPYSMIRCPSSDTGYVYLVIIAQGIY